jgi:hypothetical protein
MLRRDLQSGAMSGTPGGPRRVKLDRGEIVTAALDGVSTRPDIRDRTEHAVGAVTAEDFQPAGADIEAIVAAVCAADRAVAVMDGRYVVRCVIARIAREATGDKASGGAMYRRIAAQLERHVTPPAGMAMSPPRV